MDYTNPTTLCTTSMTWYIRNMTSSYTDKSNEPTMVAASVIMFVLAGLFFNLNLFSGVSATLDPKVRLFLTSALSLFLPVMSYLFSEAKNTTSSSGPGTGDLSLRAGLILTWMLLIELLRKKVDEIRMRGYSGTIQRAGRVAWLGSLVFFNIRTAGRKAVFSVLWILCATKVVQRIFFTEAGKRSYSHGKNARLVSSYMAQILEQDDHDHHEHQLQGARDVEQQDDGNGGNELLKTCKYIVTGEEELVKEPTADGYELNKIGPNDCSMVTVGEVWELAESRSWLFTTYDQDQGLRRLCLSFALFKLLRRRFEHLPAMAKQEVRNCRDLILKGLYSNGDSTAAEALFQVMNDEVNFLSEYHHSVVPVVLASPFFLLTNYFLLPIVVFALCVMTIIICGNGDVRYALSSLREDNYTLDSGVGKIALCLLSRAAYSPAAFFSIVDLSITILLFIIFFYEEIWEFLVFLLSNWFMVSLLCNYVAKPHWRERLTFRGAFCCIMWLRSKVSHGGLCFKQFSVLNLRWPLGLPLFATFSLAMRTELVPSNLKQSILKCLADTIHDGRATQLTKGKSALVRHNLSDHLSWACESKSVTEVILTWHIATSLLEEELPAAAGSAKDDDEGAASSRAAAISLSRYCAYLVAFHPELLPDNQEKVERVFDKMKEELKETLGCPEYYLSWRRTKVKKIQLLAAAGRPAVENSKEVVRNGAKLGAQLIDEANKEAGGLGTAVWNVVADVWTELIVYIAPSSDEERVKGHEQVLVQGGEFITVLWALAMHTGISRPLTGRSTAGDGHYHEEN
ncbi:hypothetical protein ACP4OV_017324 [Aristida adscensionis]